MCTDCLFLGAVLMILMSLTPIREKCKVLGIGVAVKVRQSKGGMDRK